MDKAEAFQDWVYEVVLPRKTDSWWIQTKQLLWPKKAMAGKARAWRAKSC